LNRNTKIAGGKVMLRNDGYVKEFAEGTSNTFINEEFVNCGVYIAEPEVIKMIPENAYYDFGKDLFPKMLKQNIPINAYVIDGYCLGLDTKEAFLKAEKILMHELSLKLPL
jgi:mannose-1-phosphate guanylyltransferase/phosphomannomutase